MSAPGFWDNNERAISISGKHAAITKRINTFSGLESRVAEIDELIEFAREEGDAESANEVRKEFQEVSRQLNELELELLLSGEHDDKNTFLTVQAGTGGTEACDWAEMLLRQYQRWAERRAAWEDSGYDQAQLSVVFLTSQKKQNGN